MTILFHSLKVEIGESQTYYFQKYHLEYGLNLFRVFDIKQDSTGFIWFSHLKGISVYDGFEFKELLSQNDNPKPQFIRIFIDKKDIKWFLPRNLRDSILYYENKEWKSISPVIQNDLSNFNFSIDVNYENGKPVIYAGTSKGLYRYSELLADNSDSLSEVEKREFAGNLYKLSTNLYDLVSKLLHWAQFQSGKMKYIPEKIKLKEPIEELIENFEGNLKMKKIDVSILIDGEHYVYADRNMMVILFNNLISNAIKFSNLKGVIIITSKYLIDNKSVMISVKDNGVGIPPSQLSSMFQTKGTTLTYGTNKESGTGIGLILCKDIVEKNFGSISVESREGYGSTFIVELPVE